MSGPLELKRDQKMFKKIGIVGGVSWRPTVTYYSEICRRSEERHLSKGLEGPPSIPEIVVESLDENRAVAYLGLEDDEQSWTRFDDYHRAALKRLEASGVEVAVMASNSPHHRFEQIVRGIRIPVISILETAAREARRIGARQVLILGTPLVMRSAKFREGFAKYGIVAAGPQEEAPRVMAAELISELQCGRTDGAADRVAEIIKMAFEGHFTGHPVVCLACTELPLAFESLQTHATFKYGGVSYINTTAAHINALFDFAVNGNSG
jgi:aspartate racemase